MVTFSLILHFPAAAYDILLEEREMGKAQLARTGTIGGCFSLVVVDV